MKKLRYLLTFLGTWFLLCACASNKELIVKLYDEKSKQEITDPSNYEIVTFIQANTPNALQETISNPKVWFGGRMSAPSRKLKILKADENGIFHLPIVHSLSDFLVVLNKEKSLVACFSVKWRKYLSLPECMEKDSYSGRDIYDITCKDEQMGDKERRKYYGKIFNDMCIDEIGREKLKYGVSNHWQIATKNDKTGEKFVMPLYIEGSHPKYLLINQEGVDEDGELKDFFHLKD